MAKYRGAVIGLGWMGLLYDLAERIGDLFEIDDIDRPTPDLAVHPHVLNSRIDRSRGSRPSVQPFSDREYGDH